MTSDSSFILPNVLCNYFEYNGSDTECLCNPGPYLRKKTVTGSTSPLPKCRKNFRTVKMCSATVHGQKLLKFQEKPSSVHKMQENAWRPGLRPDLVEYSQRFPSPSPPAGGKGISCPFPRTSTPLSAFRPQALALRASSVTAL